MKGGPQSLAGYEELEGRAGRAALGGVVKGKITSKIFLCPNLRPIKSGEALLSEKG